MNAPVKSLACHNVVNKIRMSDVLTKRSSRATDLRGLEMITLGLELSSLENKSTWKSENALQMIPMLLNCLNVLGSLVFICSGSRNMSQLMLDVGLYSEYISQSRL